MRVKPILFSPEMVRAILAGRKSQTRRTASLEDVNERADAWTLHSVGPLGYMAKQSVKGEFGATFESREIEVGTVHVCPQLLPYAPGDHLYVREAWRTAAQDDHLAPSEMGPHIIGYQADCKPGFIAATGRLRAAMHMPRWASRITLKVTSVRVERVQDISAADVVAEGVDLTQPNITLEHGVEAEARACFALLWDSLNKKRGYGWETNPWVSVASFEPIIQNVDAYLAKEA